MPQQGPSSAEHVCPNPPPSPGLPAPGKPQLLRLLAGTFSGSLLSSLAVRKWAVPNKWWHDNFLHHVSCQGGQQIPLTTSDFTASLHEACWGEINQLWSPASVVCSTAAAQNRWRALTHTLCCGSGLGELQRARERSCRVMLVITRLD